MLAPNSSRCRRATSNPASLTASIRTGARGRLAPPLAVVGHARDGALCCARPRATRQHAARHARMTRSAPTCHAPSTASRRGGTGARARRRVATVRSRARGSSRHHSTVAARVRPKATTRRGSATTGRALQVATSAASPSGVLGGAAQSRAAEVRTTATACRRRLNRRTIRARSCMTSKNVHRNHARSTAV